MESKCFRTYGKESIAHTCRAFIIGFVIIPSIPIFLTWAAGAIPRLSVSSLLLALACWLATLGFIYLCLLNSSVCISESGIKLTGLSSELKWQDVEMIIVKEQRRSFSRKSEKIIAITYKLSGKSHITAITKGSDETNEILCLLQNYVPAESVLIE